MSRIFLIGYMGSGKSTIGRLLAQRLNFQFVDTDKWIEAKKRSTVSAIFEQEGEVAFRLLEKNALREVGEFENTIIATGGGIPCFFDNMQYMNKKGITVYLKWSAEDLEKRLIADNTNKRPLLAKYNEKELLEYIQRGLTEREPYYSEAQLTVSGTEQETVSKIADYFLGVVG